MAAGARRWTWAAVHASRASGPRASARRGASCRAEVAWRQASEYGEPPLRELLRYVVHGLLHLAGHEDASPEDRARMEEAQEAVVAALWTPEMAAETGCC